MRGVSSFAVGIGAAAVLAACSSTSGSTGPGGSGSSSSSLYGICSSGPSAPEATLGMFVSGEFGFTLPLPAGQMQTSRSP